MREEVKRISASELCCLLGGPDEQFAIHQRLKGYEVAGIVKPEIRRQPLILSGLMALAPAMQDVRYYSQCDAQALAPFEREIARLRPVFCQWAFGTPTDPATVAVPAARPPAEVQQPDTPLTTVEIKRRVLGIGSVKKDGGKAKWAAVIANKSMRSAARIGSPLPGQSARWDLQRFLLAAKTCGYEFHFMPGQPTLPPPKRGRANSVFGGVTKALKKG